jgi:hypothetical protein
MLAAAPESRGDVVVSTGRIQSIIDRLRGKPRRTFRADAFALAPAAARRKAIGAGHLEQLFYAHEGRIAHKWHHYLEIYEGLFEKLRVDVSPVHLLEIGVSRGGSLELWRKYFEPTARIVGIDVDVTCTQRVDPENAIVIGDQADPAVLASAIARLGALDIVIDDGSHFGRDQIASFEYLYPRLSDRGIYICEDLLYSYCADHEGGLRRPGTFVEHAKELIDRLHAWYLDEGLKAQFMTFATTTYGIHFYPMLVAIEKRPVTAPYHVQIGK